MRPVGQIISKIGLGGESILRRVLPGHDGEWECVCIIFWCGENITGDERKGREGRGQKVNAQPPTHAHKTANPRVAHTS